MGSSEATYHMVMVVLVNIGSILEVAVTLVANIITESTLTNTIQVISERSACGTSTFIPTIQFNIVPPSIWTSCGLWSPNKLVSNTRQTQRRPLLSTLPELDFSRFWVRALYRNNPSSSKPDFSHDKPKKKSKRSVVLVSSPHKIIRKLCFGIH